MCLLGSNLISEWAGLSFFDIVSSFLMLDSVFKRKDEQ